MVREKKRRKKSVLVTPKINPAWLDPAHAVQRVQHPTRRRSTKNGAKYRPRIASPAPLSPDSLGPIFIIHGVWLGLSAFIIQTYKESCLCVESGISLLFLISIFDEIIGGPTLFQLLSIPRAFYHLCLSLFFFFWEHTLVRCWDILVVYSFIYTRPSSVCPAGGFPWNLGTQLGRQDSG